MDETTATLPAGWRERLVPIRNENTRGATGWCLEVHDPAVSKLVAGREKDLAFIAALFRHKLAASKVLGERLGRTPLPDSKRALAAERLNRLAAEGDNEAASRSQPERRNHEGPMTEGGNPPGADPVPSG